MYGKEERQEGESDKESKVRQRITNFQSWQSLGGSRSMARVIRDLMSREARSPSDLMLTPAIS